MRVNIWVGDERIETDTELPVPVEELRGMRERQNIRDLKQVRVARPPVLTERTLIATGKVRK